MTAPEQTPCSDPPCGHDTDHLCDTHETERAHAAGDHQWCGITCTEEFTAEKLRNGILWRAAPGSKAMLDELLRRARQETETSAEKRLQAVTEAVVLWRDRPGGDIGLALALAGILDAEQPEPPAATALVRVLRECDRIERAVRARPTNPDFDGAYLACLRHIREAAGPVPADEDR